MSPCVIRVGAGRRGAARVFRGVQAVMPPSVVSAEPVMKLACGLARNETTVAMSLTWPYSLWHMKLRSRSAAGPVAGFMSVSIGPGWTTLMVMPRGPRSRAAPRANLFSAALEAE